MSRLHDIEDRIEYGLETFKGVMLVGMVLFLGLSWAVDSVIDFVLEDVKRESKEAEEGLFGVPSYLRTSLGTVIRLGVVARCKSRMP